MRGSNGFAGGIGLKGATGPQGPMGETGDFGFAGRSGVKGNAGMLGREGPKGDTGFTGSMGRTGIAGRIGFTGFVGVPGFMGSTGQKGNTGATGFEGRNGRTGVVGQMGAQGPNGGTGSTGSAGRPGFGGFRGFTGATGPVGFPGPNPDGSSYDSILRNGCAPLNCDESCEMSTVQTNGATTFSFYCACTVAYTKVRVASGFRCDRLNACNFNNGGCSQICSPQFINSVAIYLCSCNNGFLLQNDGTSCERSANDIPIVGGTTLDELKCNVNNGFCEHTCIPGNPDRCRCKPGFLLSANGRSCIDIDECKARTANCGTGKFCLNFQGYHSCVGFQFIASRSNSANGQPFASQLEIKKVDSDLEEMDQLEDDLKRTRYAIGQLKTSFFALLTWSVVLALALVMFSVLILRRWKKKDSRIHAPDFDTLSTNSMATVTKEPSIASNVSGLTSISKTMGNWQRAKYPGSHTSWKGFGDNNSTLSGGSSGSVSGMSSSSGGSGGGGSHKKNTLSKVFQKHKNVPPTPSDHVVEDDLSDNKVYETPTLESIAEATN